MAQIDAIVTREQLKQRLEEITASVAGQHDVNRVECVRCDLLIHKSGTKYSAVVTTDLKKCHTAQYYESYMGEWLKKFRTFTNISWCSRNSGRKKFPTSRTYKCHQKLYSTKNTAQYASFQNLLKLVGGPDDCLAHVTFKFVLNDKKACKGSKITIVINNSYCKRLHIQNYFLELASGDESWTEKYLYEVNGPRQDHSDPIVRRDRVYYQYFADGHTFRTAKMLHLLTLLCEYGNNAPVLSDQTKNPLLSYVTVIYRQFKTYMNDDYNFEVIMSRKQAEKQQLGGLVQFQNQDMVTIITPTMKRVLCSYELDEVIISSSAVSQGPMVTLFFIPSKVGALCFACVIHKPQVAYSKVYSTLKSLIEKYYTIKLMPASVVISDFSSSEQRIDAEIIFQNSQVFIAPWSLCNNAWVWICTSKHTTKPYRHEAMLHFHNIMNAPNSETALANKKKFMSRMSTSNLRFFQDHLNEIWREYNLKIWWSDSNNPLVALSITLLQQLFIQKCASFEIIHMGDIINVLDKHFQNILLSWVDRKQPILKIHSQFLDKSELKSMTLELISPREFLIEGVVMGTVRTDTWCCNCHTGRKGAYCEHMRILMDLTDVSMPLSCDEKHLLKHIAGVNDDINTGGNCVEATKIHPTYTDGYYLFHIPINNNLQYTCDGVYIELSLSGKESYNLVINDMIEKYKLSNPLDGSKYSRGYVKRNVSSEPVAGREAAQNFIEEQNRKKKSLQKEEKIDNENAIQSKHLSKESGSQKINREGEISFSQQNKEILHHTIDLKIEIMSTEDDDSSSPETTPAVVCGSVNNFEAEYNTSLENLRKEFKKFTDGLQLSSSDNKLNRIVQLTKEFNITRMNLK